MSKRKKNPALKAVKATRGIERAAHFENGGDLVSWRGGPHTVRVDRKSNKIREPAAASGNRRKPWQQ